MEWIIWAYDLTTDKQPLAPEEPPKLASAADLKACGLKVGRA